MSEWRPIKTAPRDGTPIMLGWAPNGLPVEHVEEARWQGEDWRPLRARDSSIVQLTEATHWKPRSTPCKT